MTAVTLHPHVTLTEMADGLILLDQRSGRYWQMNTTAALILSTLLDGATSAEAAARLAREHPGGTDRAEADVTALLHALQASELTAGESPVKGQDSQ